ncbi:MAG: tRNA (5-methylaminomethyl-2-thiouridine)(34)-methyltransferase MnmD [Draconibacterium sp.]|nr:tRNA (5-methylaminomethyl-2-thiouridine)(34)-methyltransferase MnmD [Draconibacterium sp.]
MKLRIINTDDGSQTVYNTELEEQYHSVKGAITESNYVYIEKGYLFHKSENPTIFEVGFGTGLNCLLTAILAEKQKRHTTYFTIEKYPIDKKIIHQLKYGENISTEAQVIFKKIHACEWNSPNKISEYFTLIKLQADILKNDLKKVEESDIIYFDAFGPDKQPEMWQADILKKIYSITAANGIFLTYSAKGDVRRQLKKCGYEMKRLPGPPGKFHMLRGIKKV